MSKATSGTFRAVALSTSGNSDLDDRVLSETPAQAGTVRLSRKQWQRQQAEILIDEAETLDDLQVRRVPTKLHIRCPCGHQGSVEVFLDKPPRLRCVKCGNRNPIICSRDRSRVWSGQRRGR